MDARELRIENWVNRTNKLTREKLTIELTASCILDISANGEMSSFIYEPIPLTEEWLLKFGFEKKETILHTFFENDYGDFYFSLQLMNNNSFHLRVRNDSQENERYTGLGIFKYVHQLQNLYFALTNQELCVK